MKIYIVTSGWYSDYTIEAVFLDKDKAQKFADITYNANPIEKFDTMDDNLGALINDKMETSDDFPYEIIQVSLSGEYKPYVRFFTDSDDDNVYGTSDSYDYLLYKKKIKYNISDHDKIKDKAIEAAYDLRAFARSLKSEGYTNEMINKMINNKEND